MFSIVFDGFIDAICTHIFVELKLANISGHYSSEKSCIVLIGIRHAEVRYLNNRMPIDIMTFCNNCERKSEKVNQRAHVLSAFNQLNKMQIFLR